MHRTASARSMACSLLVSCISTDAHTGSCSVAVNALTELQSQQTPPVASYLHTFIPSYQHTPNTSKSLLIRLYTLCAMQLGHDADLEAAVLCDDSVVV